jgi:hypothetical protein
MLLLKTAKIGVMVLGREALRFRAEGPLVAFHASQIFGIIYTVPGTGKSWNSLTILVVPD